MAKSEPRAEEPGTSRRTWGGQTAAMPSNAASADSSHQGSESADVDTHSAVSLPVSTHNIHNSRVGKYHGTFENVKNIPKNQIF